MKDTAHVSVMTQEALEGLRVKAGHWYVDATLGRGGHTQGILAAGGNVLALDFDEAAVQRAQQQFASAIANKKLVVVRENFDRLSAVVTRLQKENLVADIHGILFDFGTSTDQLMDQQRGLSFENPDAPLDMRMDNRLGVKASDLLKLLSVKQLAGMFREWGGEESAMAIAKGIHSMREKDPAQLETVGSLLAIVSKHKPYRTSHLNPATKVFQALRIAVNDELDNIERALPQALDELAPSGRLVTIAFHEGEDRQVKRAFGQWEEQGKGKRITPKPLQPTAEEVQTNPRSRSAKLRIFERN